jgi:hypothetical protein
VCGVGQYTLNAPLLKGSPLTLISVNKESVFRKVLIKRESSPKQKNFIDYPKMVFIKSGNIQKRVYLL